MSLTPFSLCVSMHVCMCVAERETTSKFEHVCVWLVSMCPERPSAMDFRAAVTGLTSDLWIFYCKGTSLGAAFASIDWCFILGFFLGCIVQLKCCGSVTVIRKQMQKAFIYDDNETILALKMNLLPSVHFPHTPSWRICGCYETI